MAIISDEEYVATVALLLIETFLSKNNSIILDNLVYKCIKYLSQGDEEEYDLCKYFNNAIEEAKEESDRSHSNMFSTKTQKGKEWWL